MNLESNISVLINGKPVDCLSSLDRGLLFGDGVFETLAVADGESCFWLRHLQRLGEGCRRLHLPVPDEVLLRNEAAELLNGHGACVLKIIVTRGAGGRGYRATESIQPTRIVQRHPWPALPQECATEGVRVRLCETRLGSNPQLAGIKHLNRLEQVLARQEWNDPGIREGLMLDGEGHVIEGTMSNLFAVIGGTLVTPDLTRCGVAGIMRTVVMEIAEEQSMPVQVTSLAMPELEQADEIFLTNSLIGIWPVTFVNKVIITPGPVTRRLQNALGNLVVEGDTWRY